ncbi:CheR family methyltransferase [Salinibius halmophilus]|uniref:CheR family methyltransferase n=1 Tax=Salinibius halmophilus TaxID=1853216 RepID=UPI000E667A9B|nr:protein-glutamate O-methyltransferase CheR [Salinibius halmophilus]
MQTDLAYDAFCSELEKLSGICLGAGKQYLVSSRLRNIMKSHDLASLSDVVKKLKSEPRGKFATSVVDAMTTNETLWFRDSHPYEILKSKILPELLKTPGRSLRIWSAACSSGQEPYSISMILEEYFQSSLVNKGNVKIVATDLSESILEEARNGVYASLAVGRGLDPQRLKRWFDATTDGQYKVKPQVAQRVEFRKLNLLESYALVGKFEVVFCRNVLIYFTPEVKKQILLKIHGVLAPGGYLLLGGSEAISGLSDKFEMVHCRPGIIYKKI